MVNPSLVSKVYEDYLTAHPALRDDIVLERPFPFERYRVYEDWEPKPVRLLLLAESPPWSRPENYFYNPGCESNLSREVFRLMKIDGRTKGDRL